METMVTQTAFRLRNDLIERMKRKARLQGKSVNKYVENLIEKDLAEDEDRYESVYKELSRTKLSSKVSPELNDLVAKYKVSFSKEELESDDKLAYLLSK